MPKIDNVARDRIRGLNDQFRRTFVGGRIVLTAGVTELPKHIREMVLRNVATFDTFKPDNDPHGEHDFGAFDVAGNKIFFKIDYYDKTLEFGSPNPSDPTVTTRVMTIMLAEEY